MGMYRGCSGPTASCREDDENVRIVHCGHFHANADDNAVLEDMSAGDEDGELNGLQLDVSRTFGGGAGVLGLS